jgi:hypothetical protein
MIGLLLIRITGTPVFPPVRLCISLKAAASLDTSTSLNGIFFSRRYLFAALQKVQVGVVKIITFGTFIFHRPFLKYE